MQRLTLRRALSAPKVMTLSLVYFGLVGALHHRQFWLPQIVKAFGLWAGTRAGSSSRPRAGEMTGS